MAMPPVAVADFLKRRACQTKDEAREDAVDAEAEKALSDRTDPLITLSLARFGRHIEIVSEIFQSAVAASPIRMACLSNTCVAQGFFGRFPEELFNWEIEAVAEWISTASTEEMSALFENPTLDDNFLRDLLERRNGWEVITPDRLCLIVSILIHNPRMRTPRDNSFLDGWAEFSYTSVFNAAWKLAESVPVNKDWANVLGWLYEKLETEAFSIKEPLKIAARWHSDPTDAEAHERQAKDHKIGFLGDMERVRKGLAMLALRNSGELLAKLLVSDDLVW